MSTERDWDDVENKKLLLILYGDKGVFVINVD